MLRKIHDGRVDTLGHDVNDIVDNIAAFIMGIFIINLIRAENFPRQIIKIAEVRDRFIFGFAFLQLVVDIS